MRVLRLITFTGMWKRYFGGHKRFVPTQGISGKFRNDVGNEANNELQKIRPTWFDPLVVRVVHSSHEKL
jgi:hypothetical protein